jgi:hypothetical protein
MRRNASRRQPTKTFHSIKNRIKASYRLSQQQNILHANHIIHFGAKEQAYGSGDRVTSVNPHGDFEEGGDRKRFAARLYQDSNILPSPAPPHPQAICLWYLLALSCNRLDAAHACSEPLKVLIRGLSVQVPEVHHTGVTSSRSSWAAI